MINSRFSIQRLLHGFTLVELLVVISILGVLSTIGLVAFSSSQMRGRDTQRKSDLKQISSALEIYYNDYNVYPTSYEGLIMGCPTTTIKACAWGVGQFSDEKTVYIKTLPKDPSKSYSYYYRTVSVNGVINQGFQIYAKLENSQDPSCLDGDCTSPPALPSGVTCGGSATDCNFSVTSPNTTATTN